MALISHLSKVIKTLEPTRRQIATKRHLRYEALLGFTRALQALLTPLWKIRYRSRTVAFHFAPFMGARRHRPDERQPAARTKINNSCLRPQLEGSCNSSL